MKRRLLAATAALVLALAGGAVLVAYARGADARAAAGLQTVEVLVVERLVPEGTPAGQPAGHPRGQGPRRRGGRLRRRARDAVALPRAGRRRQLGHAGGHPRQRLRRSAMSRIVLGGADEELALRIKEAADGDVLLLPP